MDAQLRIDFPRAEQLGILRDARLPGTAGVAAVVLKGVLRVLDDHGRGRTCWLLHETIAAEAGVSVRQARRATRALAELGLVCVERRRIAGGSRASCNHYTLVWGQLALLRRADQSATGPDQSAIRAPSNGHTGPINRPSATDQTAICDPSIGHPWPLQEKRSKKRNDEDERNAPEDVRRPSSSECWTQHERDALCRAAYAVLRPERRKPPSDPHERATIRTLAELALEHYGEAWLLAAFADAVRKRPGDLAWAKGTAANQTGDRDLFLARFDERIRSIRSPPAAVRAGG